MYDDVVSSGDYSYMCSAGNTRAPVHCTSIHRHFVRYDGETICCMLLLNRTVWRQVAVLLTVLCLTVLCLTVRMWLCVVVCVGVP